MIRAKFLEYEVSLLLAEFGRNDVLKTLSVKLRLSDSELYQELEQVGGTPRLTKSKSPKTAEELVAKLIASRPEKADQLIDLVRRFQNREFLPTLRAVQHFIDKYTNRRSKLTSRDKALPKVLAVLSEMDLTELQQLSQDNQPSEYSALALISKEILRSRTQSPGS